MSNNMNRILTLRVTIKDPEKAKAIWDAHLESQVTALGFEVRAIADGDVFAERDQMEQYLDYLEERRIFEDGKVPDFEEWKAQA